MMLRCRTLIKPNQQEKRLSGYFLAKLSSSSSHRYHHHASSCSRAFFSSQQEGRGPTNDDDSNQDNDVVLVESRRRKGLGDQSNQRQQHRFFTVNSSSSSIRGTNHNLSSLLHHQLEPNHNHQQQHQQRRNLSSLASYLPEFVQGYTIWGGAGYLLKTFHMDGVIPYWVCFSMINICVRTALFPLTLYSAQTIANLRPVAPEIQFLFSLYESNFRVARREMMSNFRYIFKEGLESLRAIYKLNKVNPLAPFLSPLLQMPVFIYVSTDLRKIINGRDPELAQALTDVGTSSGGDSGTNLLFWINDLTEADPYYILPIFAGLAMYANVEVALGKRTLAGEATSKASSAQYMKDIFQSVAIFMPCFSAHFPAGMQVYLCTTFCFTAAQSYALRQECFRQLVGLPSLLVTDPIEPVVGKQLLDLKEFERKADEIRGDGPILGKGVMVKGFRVSMPGSIPDRASTIQVDDNAPRAMFDLIETASAESTTTIHIPKLKVRSESFDERVPFVSGVTAPYEEMVGRMKEEELVKRIQQQLEEAAAASTNDDNTEQTLTEEQMIELMEKANRGMRPVLSKDDQLTHEKEKNKKKDGKLEDTPSLRLNSKRFNTKSKKKKGGGGGGGRKQSKRRR